ncbi:MAG: hypothetical protein RBR69_00920 [Candidatus Cloacimonadaceae bacterium]|jgi:DNA-directed RNA polymerase subunit F|nr:hypothetical protein [Candidatus Cloacimonadota bacterium]MDY0126685.1 hypothetical protein [Candidatus Cloacimonadaceae bacterium]MCB5255579.1 hypothetical protein [Candidatus Cloacimonadota bacterium]MCK9177407.1 hypothetical protein [Candidatus Cloacimonadota bacterium]MCK9241685.1 hypothetical protein [Candidatus Cloacimonadota bacterium]
MLTIDWKERLTLDTEDYLLHKLPKKDYDFEIIFIAYPERVNGKIPSEVITFISGVMVRKIAKKHLDYIPFYKHLWLKKEDYGKLAFGGIIAKLMRKNPDVYIPLLEEMMHAEGNTSQINALLDKVMLPLTRRKPEDYLEKVLQWTKSEKEEIAWAATNLCLKLIKRREDLIPQVLTHFENQWVYPLGEVQGLHVNFLKTVAKLDPEAYYSVWEEFGFSRDPQIVELLCAAIVDYHPEIMKEVELWTKSGNARVKKASLSAMKVLKRKKGARA